MIPENKNQSNPERNEAEVKCGRNGCEDRETRIDGYCSIYCRDVAELEDENKSLRSRLSAIEEEANISKLYTMLWEAMREEGNLTLARLKEIMHRYLSGKE